MSHTNETSQQLIELEYAWANAMRTRNLEKLNEMVVEDFFLAIAVQGSLLVRFAPPAVADAFCAGRLGDARGRVFGTLPAGVDGAAIVARALAV